jgi:beta-glucosidase
LSTEAPAAFEAFAERAARAFGDLVDLWATQNEPNVLVYMGYAGERWPPGLASLTAGQRAFAHLLEAHARGYAALRRVEPRSRVGLVLSLPLFDPARARTEDRVVAEAQDWVFSGAILRALKTGHLLPPLSVPGQLIAGLANSIDWLGVNYYGRYRVKFALSAARELFGARVTEGNIRTEWTDWGQPFAAGLTRQLLRLTPFGVPLYVTENGVMDASDALRPELLREHLLATHAAMTRGADVRGYFHWSLLDNFEWAEGWSAHFGLHALDRTTQARTLRPSGELYAEICRTRSLSG